MIILQFFLRDLILFCSMEEKALAQNEDSSVNTEQELDVSASKKTATPQNYEKLKKKRQE